MQEANNLTHFLFLLCEFASIYLQHWRLLLSLYFLYIHADYSMCCLVQTIFQLRLKFKQRIQHKL